jgi:hypothetical protein
VGWFFILLIALLAKAYTTFSGKKFGEYSMATFLLIFVEWKQTISSQNILRNITH